MPTVAARHQRPYYAAHTGRITRGSVGFFAPDEPTGGGIGPALLRRGKKRLAQRRKVKKELVDLTSAMLSPSPRKIFLIFFVAAFLFAPLRLREISFSRLCAHHCSSP